MTDTMDRRSMAAGLANRQAVLWGDIAKDKDLELGRFSAVERLSDPYKISIEVISAHFHDFEPELGSAAGVNVAPFGNTERVFRGRIFEARHLKESEVGVHYELTIRPWLSLLDLNLNSRFFQNKSAIQVIRSVLGSNKFRVAGELPAAATTARGYCNQYRESDFAFVSRLMEEVGIYYYFDHKADGEEMVLCCGPDAHSTVNGLGSLNYGQLDGARQQGLSIWSWTEQLGPAAQIVTLRDHHHHKVGSLPAALTSTKRGEAGGAGPAHTSELYDYPGGQGSAATHGAGDGMGVSFAEVRLQSARAERRRFAGEGDAFALACGSKFTLNGHDNEAWNQDYLIVGVSHALADQTYSSGGGGGGGELMVSVEAIPFSVQWRSPLKTPKPAVAGPTTATVVGPDGEVIHVDSDCRVRVRFPWDRRAPGDLKDEEGENDARFGIWIRVSQAWADGGFGLMNIPRIGAEVVVDFVDGDPDLPLITGRLHSEGDIPPVSLPGNKTQSTWKSQTVGDAGDYPDTEEPPPKGKHKGWNEIRLEDKGGAEQIYMHAQREMEIWTRLDTKQKTGRNYIERVGYDRKTNIKRHETIEVEEGDETHTVKAGSRKTVINKSDDLTVETGDSITNVKTGDYKLTVDSKTATIDAATKITLKCGGSTIEMTPTKIEIKSLAIKIQGVDVGVEATTTKVMSAALTDIKGVMVKINCP